MDNAESGQFHHRRNCPRLNAGQSNDPSRGRVGPYDLPILNNLVPHTGHVPRVAGRPFFSVTLSGLLISRFARHLKQYACIQTPPEIVARTYSEIVVVSMARSHVRFHLWGPLQPGFFLEALTHSDRR